MSEAILMSSSVTATNKQVRINHDRTTTYIDHYVDGNLVANFTMKRGDWATFIMSEVAELR